MKVVLKRWGGDGQEMSLATYLTPSEDSDGGSLERAQGLARKNAEAIGHILAKMVAHKLMTFSEAESAAGEYGGELIL